MDAKNLTVVLAVGLLSWVRAARAEEQLPHASLLVLNPPSSPRCVDESVLAARVRAQLSSRARAEHGLAPLSLDVQIHRTSTAMLAELHVSGRTPGLRKIEAARCEGLTEALAVSIAMVLDQEAQDALESPDARVGTATPDAAAAPGSTVGASASGSASSAAASSRPETGAFRAAAPNAPANTPAASPQTPAPTRAAPPAPTPATQQPKLTPASQTPASDASIATDPTSAATAGHLTEARLPERDLRVWLGAGTGSSNRFHLELGGEYSAQSWALQLGAFFEPTHQQTLSSGQLETLGVGGLLAGCRRFGTEFRIAPCLRVTLGMERVDSHGFDENTRPTQLLVATLGPTLGVETGRQWILGLDLMGLFGLPRRTYQIENVVERRTVEEKSPAFVLWLVARVAFSSAS